MESDFTLECVDNWDEDVIKLLLEKEEEITAKRNFTQAPVHISHPVSNSLSGPDGGDDDMFIFSPPRELSQRVSNGFAADKHPKFVPVLQNDGHGRRHWDQETTWQLVPNEAEVTAEKKFTQAPSAHISHPVSKSLVGSDGGDDSMSTFSPPRELSQRVSDGFVADKHPNFVPVPQNGGRGRGRWNRSANSSKNDKEKENQIVKDHDFRELKKDRDKKDEELKCALSQIKSKDFAIHRLKETRVQSEACAQDDAHKLLQAHCTGNSLDQDVSGYPTDTKDTSTTPWAREGASKRLSRNPSSSILKDGEPSSDYQRFKSYAPSRKKVPIDGLSAASDLNRRLLNDSAMRPKTPNESSIQEVDIVCLGESARPKCCKTIGVQTDPWEDCVHSSTEDYFSAKHDLSKKLIGIWKSANDKRSGKNLVSKLFTTCAADLYVIFRCTNMSNNMQGQAEKSLSDRTLHDGMQPVQSIESEKVGQLYEILMKMINEMAQLDTLLEALFDLCLLENVDIVYRSLRVMHVILHYLLSFEMRSCRRENIVVVDSQNMNVHEDKKNILIDKILGCQKNVKNPGVPFAMDWDMTSCRGLFSSSTKSYNMENLCKEGQGSGRMVVNSGMNWMELFEKVQRIALENMDPCIKEEAVSIMSLIIMRSNPNNEREKFGTITLFESMSQLLCEKVGALVRLQAVRLLFLLLNCPKVLKLFCLGCKDGVEYATADGLKNDPESQGRCRSILESLSECLACIGDNTQERILGRHTIHVLAFIATSDKSGIEVLLNPGTSKKINFPELLVKTLSSELDAEEALLAKSKTIALEGPCKERTSLMREALILLCRLVSNSDYSGAVLEALTSSRTMSRLTIDVTNRIIGMNKWYWKSDVAKKTQMNHADLSELARVLRSRILPSS